MVTVKLSRKSSFTLPPVFRRFAKKGDEFMIAMSGDTFMLKPVRKPIWEVARTIADKKQPSLEELCEIVREVRRENRRGK